MPLLEYDFNMDMLIADNYLLRNIAYPPCVGNLQVINTVPILHFGRSIAVGGGQACPAH